MRALALALALLTGACARAAIADNTNVSIPAGDLALRGHLAVPTRPVAPSVVALHGCGGPWPQRDAQWEQILTGAGHTVVFPDSFGSRGIGSQCQTVSRTVRPGRERRDDAVAAVRWLLAQPDTPKGGAVVLGWSNGGSTVLAAAAQDVMPPGAVRGFIAFYPGCAAYAKRPDWAPSAPLLILMGADDDWTPAEPCRTLAARYPDKITLVTYPGAYHDFDVPGHAIRLRAGLAYTAGRNGFAHTGSDPAGREDAIRRVLAFLQAIAT